MTRRGARASGSGVPCEVSCNWRELEGMSSPPLSEPGHRAGLFFQTAGSFVNRLACPRPWYRIRKHFLARKSVLAAWPSCRGTRELAASELAVVLSTTPCSRTQNAWPVRPRLARTRRILCPNLLRAFQSVPSGAAVRADRNTPHPLTPVAPSIRSKSALDLHSVTPTPVSPFHGEPLPMEWEHEGHGNPVVTILRMDN